MPASSSVRDALHKDVAIHSIIKWFEYSSGEPSDERQTIPSELLSAAGLQDQNAAYDIPADLTSAQFLEDLQHAYYYNFKSIYNKLIYNMEPVLTAFDQDMDDKFQDLPDMLQLMSRKREQYLAWLNRHNDNPRDDDDDLELSSSLLPDCTEPTGYTLSDTDCQRILRHAFDATCSHELMLAYHTHLNDVFTLGNEIIMQFPIEERAPQNVLRLKLAKRLIHLERINFSLLIHRGCIQESMFELFNVLKAQGRMDLIDAIHGEYSDKPEFQKFLSVWFEAYTSEESMPHHDVAIDCFNTNISDLTHFMGEDVQNAEDEIQSIHFGRR